MHEMQNVMVCIYEWERGGVQIAFRIAIAKA